MSEREAFEKWAADVGYPMAHEHGDPEWYVDLQTAGAWAGWKARAAQITPQAGEAEPVAWIDAHAEMPPKDEVVLMRRRGSTQIPRWEWAHYRTAPPTPVCPHLRSSDEGTQWCDLAASVGDLSPSAGKAEPFGFYSEETDTFFLREYNPVMPANTLLLYRTPQPPVAPVWQDIETAPRDGSWVLLTGGECDDDEGDDDKRAVTAQWTDYLNGGKTSWHWQFAWYDGGFYGQYKNPTHWMPLPSPPDSPGATEANT